jgi:serine phosphatase RsbU (regulator of sigma subunit)
MVKRTREHEAPQGGMTLSMRFTLLMTLALAAVMTAAGAALYTTSAKVTSTLQERTLLDAVRLSGKNQTIASELKQLAAERDLLLSINKRIEGGFPPNEEFTRLRNDLKGLWDQRAERAGELERSITWRQIEGQTVLEYDGGQVKRFPIEVGPSKDPAYLLRYTPGTAAPGLKSPTFDLLAPVSSVDSERGLLGLIIGITVVVIAVGALVAVFVGSQVSGPIEAIAQDVKQISTGDLAHKTRARGVREVNVLARSIDRMTADLAAAQEAQLELSVREREVALAAEVRESLAPNAAPERAGYEFAALALSASGLGGDFHDFIAAPDGHVGLLVCDVSGRGLPGTLVGATARAYLRAELARGEDLRQSLIIVNRELARDVRRGMYVSALYVLLDPAKHTVRVACAGHKLPLVHLSGGTVKLVQPEGIALGFDHGPVFEGRLEIAEFALAQGDRLVILNSGPVVLKDAEGKEFGEKHVYAQVQRHGARTSEDFLDRLRSVLEAHSNGGVLDREIAILTARRV